MKRWVPVCGLDSFSRENWQGVRSSPRVKTFVKLFADAFTKSPPDEWRWGNAADVWHKSPWESQVSLVPVGNRSPSWVVRLGHCETKHGNRMNGLQGGSRNAINFIVTFQISWANYVFKNTSRGYCRRTRTAGLKQGVHVSCHDEDGLCVAGPGISTCQREWGQEWSYRG